uniref:Orc1-like AAA ATPase domain-containing protein n=1 Tax=Odontella aurita TaxID=265563 RepID=A0A7S4JG53_9STRA|mmetsp:Transcript_45556/g.138446  ORF Transcript_45556/g.138446 Transcript_45556/m.138446 type:complete len:1076 (+) Transcript_45556:464-3691(+)
MQSERFVSDSYRVHGLQGTIGPQGDEAYYDDRSDANDDLEKGRIKFPKDKLYGREKELDRLESIYAHATGSDGVFSSPSFSSPSSRAVFLGGYSGVGKSALVREFSKRLVAGEAKKIQGQGQSSHFLACGKFGQGCCDNPLSAVVEATAGLASAIQQEGSEDLEEVRSAMKKAKVGEGESGDIFCSTFPSLAPLLQRAGGASTSLQESSLNFYAIKEEFRAFMKALGTRRNPVVFFIDDMQWADSASLELMTALCKDDSLRYCVFILSFRSNEVGENHPFGKAITEIRKSRGENAEDMQLFDLAPSDIGEFIADSLSKDADEVLPITEVVFSKTMGNIFYVKQALDELVRKNAIYYDVMCFEWQWNVSSVELQNFMSSDVIETVKCKIESLPVTLQRALIVMGYSRNSVDAEMLRKLLTADGLFLDAEEAQVVLERGIVEGLLIKNGGNGIVTFAHDRIQEASEAMLPAGDSQCQLRFKIAEVLLACGEEWMLFVAVSHLNALPSQYTATIDLAELNLRVGKMALKTGAHSEAVELLRAGLASLDKVDRWKHFRYSFSLHLLTTLLETEFTLGNCEQAEMLVDDILANAKCLEDKERAYLVQLELVANSEDSNYDLCVDKGLEILKRVYGQDSLSSRPGKKDVLREEALMKVALRGRPLSSLENLPLTDDDVLFQLIGMVLKHSNFAGNRRLSTFICYRSIRCAIKKGISQSFPQILAQTGQAYRMDEKFEKGQLFGNIAIKLSDRFRRGLKTKAWNIIFLHGGLLPLYQPPKASLRPLLEGHKTAILHGITEVSLGCALASIYILFAIGHPMNSLIEQKILLYENMCKNYNQQGFGTTFRTLRQFYHNLCGKSCNPTVLKGDAFDEEETLSKLEGNARKMALRDSSSLRLQLAYIFCEEGTMKDMIEILSDYPLQDVMAPRQHVRLTFLGLASLSLKDKGKHKCSEVGVKVVKYFKNLAKIGSVSARPVYLCLKAVSTPGKKAYDEAISACSECNLTHLEAIMSERCSLFFQKKDDTEQMRNYLTKAYWLYSDWGAIAKVDQLKSSHPFLKGSTRVKAGTVGTKATSSTGSWQY